MIEALVFVAAYLAGGIPTADWVASARGIDLRATGSGNPGANNARRVGGWGLGAAVLFAEMAKGAIIVLAASGLGGRAMALAAVGAVLGNVLNPYRRFVGGQGLGITAGVLAGAWPVGLVVALLFIMSLTALLRRTAPAALVTGIALIVAAAAGVPAPWGVSGADAVILAVGVAAVVTPKQLIRLRG